MIEQKNVEERLAEIETYVEAATPGPWRFSGPTWNPYVVQGNRVIAHINGPEEAVEANGTFIANIRQDFPRVLAVVQAVAFVSAQEGGCVICGGRWPNHGETCPVGQLAALGEQGEEVHDGR